MKMASADVDQYAQDRDETLRNRQRLTENGNLLYWYKQLYREQFHGLGDLNHLAVLEIGSGVSPLKRFHPEVITSDVLALDYLDHIFDCHHIDELATISDASLDVITLTNVLHHLKEPIAFLNRAAGKLKAGGKIIATEPYFSWISSLVFRHLHHEPVDFAITRPELPKVVGPLASANIALPWLIFVKNPGWSDQLRARFAFTNANLIPFSSLSYMVTGGISRRIPIPAFLYRPFFRIDLLLSRLLPAFFASFFTITLTRK